MNEIKAYLISEIDISNPPQDKEFKLIYPIEGRIEWRRLNWRTNLKTGLFTSMLHRVGGPAVTYDDGYEEWYEYSELHRIDGPAIVDPVDHVDTTWWFRDKSVVSYREFQALSGCSDEDIILLKLKWGEID